MKGGDSVGGLEGACGRGGCCVGKGMGGKAEVFKLVASVVGVGWFESLQCGWSHR